MNLRMFSFKALKRLAALAVLTLAAVGCATQKIDWAGRLGVYTFDQAVVEFGPPDKQATLQTGGVVAEWLVRRGYPYRSPAYGYGLYPGYYYGPVYPAYIDGYAPDAFLRLTFDAESKLTAWKKFSR